MTNSTIPDPATRLASLIDRLGTDGHADTFDRLDAEQELFRRVFDLFIEPFARDLLTAFEQFLIEPLREVDPDFQLSDPSKSFADRIASMSSAARQLFAESLFGLGLIVLKSSLVERSDAEQRDAAEVFATLVRKMLTRDTDLPQTLLAARTIASAVGGPLCDALAEVVVQRDAAKL